MITAILPGRYFWYLYLIKKQFCQHAQIITCNFLSLWDSTIHGTRQRRKGSERWSDFFKVTELEPGSWSSSLIQGEESNICLDRCRSLWRWAWWETGYLLIWLRCLNHLSFHLTPQGSKRDGSSWGNLEPSIHLCGGQGRGCLVLMLCLIAFFWGKGHFVVRQASLLELREDSKVEWVETRVSQVLYQARPAPSRSCVSSKAQSPTLREPLISLPTHRE